MKGPRFKEDPREWRKFALAGGVFFSLTLWLVWWRWGWFVDWVWGLQAGLVVLVLVGWWMPRGVRPVYRGALTLSHYSGQIMGRVLLGLMFGLLVLPLGLLMRMLGKDLLHLRRDRKAASYWHRARSKGSLDRMY